MPRRNPKVKRGTRELRGREKWKPGWDWEYELSAASGKELHAILIETGVLDDRAWSSLGSTEQRALEKAAAIVEAEVEVELSDETYEDEEAQQQKHAEAPERIRQFETISPGKSDVAVAKLAEGVSGTFVVGEVSSIAAGGMSWDAMLGTKTEDENGRAVFVDDEGSLTEGAFSRPSYALEQLSRELRNRRER